MMKLLVLNADCVLLNSDNKISKDTKKALQMIQKEGIVMVLVSGKGIDEINGIIDELELQKQENYAITVHGAWMKNLYTDEILIEYPLSYDAQKEIYQLSKKEGFLLAYENNHKIITDDAGNAYLKEMAQGKEIDEDFDFLDENQNLGKLMIIQNPHEQGKLSDKLRTLKDTIQLYEVGEHCMECTAKGAQREIALAHLMKQLGVTTDEVVVIGNSRKDLGMFALSDHSVAMGQAREIIKEAASLTTVNNDEEGIVNALEKLTDFIEII